MRKKNKIISSGKMFLTSSLNRYFKVKNVRRSVWRIYLEILRVKGKRTRVLGVRNNGVDIILVGETTKELKATLYGSIFGDICHQFIISEYEIVIEKESEKISKFSKK